MQFIIGFSAVGGGIGLIGTNGLGMPIDLLNRSPFNSYAIPGIILIFVVGGTHLIASLAVWKNSRNSPIYLAISGFGMLIWIFTEIQLILNPHWLQTLYFGLGLVTVIISMILLQLKSKQFHMENT